METQWIWLNGELVSIHRECQQTAYRIAPNDPDGTEYWECTKGHNWTTES